VFEEYLILGDSAEKIYDTVLKKDPLSLVVTVESMLQEMKSKDVIEEPCLKFFAKKKEKGKHLNKKSDAEDSKKIVVKKEKFRRWWTEGKLDSYEMIKYYLIRWMGVQIKNKKLDETAI